MKAIRLCSALPRLIFGLSLVSIPASILNPVAAQAGTAYNACGTGGSSNPFSILFKNLVEGDTFQCQDKKITIGDPSDLLVGDNGSGTLEFEWNQNPPPGFENDFFSLDFDFSPSTTSSSVIGFSYWLEVTSPDYALNTVQLDADINQIDPAIIPSSVTKEVRLTEADGPFVTLEADRSTTSLSESLGGNLNRIYVTDKWLVGENSTIDNYKNTYTQVFISAPPEEVPGPLPLLGAGAAFGFSRRLRGRIKASRLA